MATPVNAYYGITVALAATQAYRLLDLLAAVDSSLEGVLQNCSALMIQGHDDNGALADATVYIGDENVDATRMAYALTVHEGNPYRKEAMNIPLGAIYVYPATAGAKLNVEVIF